MKNPSASMLVIGDEVMSGKKHELNIKHLSVLEPIKFASFLKITIKRFSQPFFIIYYFFTT